MPEEFYNQSPHCWLPKTNDCLLDDLIKIQQMNPLSGIFIALCFSFFNNHQALLPDRSPGMGHMKLTGFQQQEMSDRSTDHQGEDSKPLACSKRQSLRSADTRVLKMVSKGGSGHLNLQECSQDKLGSRVHDQSCAGGSHVSPQRGHSDRPADSVPRRRGMEGNLGTI